jgi:DNA-binding CsgD family transcriptional regulator
MQATKTPARRSDRQPTIGGGGAGTDSTVRPGARWAIHPRIVAARAVARVTVTRPPDRRALTRVQQVLAPLCIVATAAAFVAEVRVSDDANAFGALAVVPVLAASMLRSRWLTLVVAVFAITLQVWGVTAGLVDRDAAGMQIAVYMLTLAVAALQQSRARLASLIDARPVAADPEDEALPPVIKVTGVEAPVSMVAGTLPDVVAQTLTRRERDVVVLAVHGFTARRIGEQLFIGERTVETHLANAYGKLGVRTKVELARLVTTFGDSEDFRTRTEAPQEATA